MSKNKYRLHILSIQINVPIYIYIFSVYIIFTYLVIQTNIKILA